MRAIDADALIKSIKECIEVKDANYEWEQVQGLECALTCIEEQPTITPERKRGRWIQTRHFGRMYRMCSSCSAERKDDLSTGWNYCPYCGAAMQEDEG